MSGDIENIRVGAGSEIFSAPLDATAPTDLDSALDAAFEGVGLIGEDGVSNAREQSSDDKYAMGRNGLVLVRTVRSKKKESFKFVLLENTDLAFRLKNPGSASENLGGGVTKRTYVVEQPDRRSWVVEILDGDIITRRYYPTAEIVEVGEVKDADSELAGPEVTVNVYPDADGVKFYEFTNDPAALPTGS